MSLAETEKAFGTFIADVIEHEAGQQRPDRIVRYHGPLPEDCCSEAGQLGVWHEANVGSDSFPQRWSGSGSKASGWQLVTLLARLSVCWPIPPRSPESGVILADADWDDRAARLDLIEEAVNEALLCASGDDPSAAKLHEKILCGQFRWIDTVPKAPSGGCTSITWRAFASLADPVGT